MCRDRLIVVVTVFLAVVVAYIYLQWYSRSLYAFLLEGGDDYQKLGRLCCSPQFLVLRILYVMPTFSLVIDQKVLATDRVYLTGCD